MKTLLPLPARRFLTLVFLGAGLAGATAASGPEAVLSAVRFWSLGDVTRVAIETTAEVQYHAERIENPDRLFVDLMGTRRRAGLRGLRTIRVEDKLIRQIRIAQTQPDVTRVVLDLVGPVGFSASQLLNPDRVMLEIRAPGQGPPVPPTEAAPPIEPQAGPAPAPVPTSGPAGGFAARPVPSPPQPVVKPAVRSTPQPAAPAAEPVKTVSEPGAAATAAGRPAPNESKPPSAAGAAAAKRNSHGEQSLIRALGLKLERVVLDPGHGGHDTGTIGRGGLAEKDLVLDVAKRLGDLIAQRLGSEVIYTRTDDTFIPLEARTALANEKKADLFLSIHANSSRARAIAGSETYYLNFTTSAEELDVAARENATSQKSIFDLQDMLQKIVRREKAQESREFADTMQKALYAGLWRGRAKNRGVKKAPFVVLIGANMPSVLAEIDFLSNPREERLLKRDAYRKRIAEALYKGVAQYAGTLSHFQVAQN